MVIFARQKPIKADLPEQAYKDEALKNFIREDFELWNAAVAPWEEEERTLWHPKDLEGVVQSNNSETEEDDIPTPDDDESNTKPSDLPRPPDFDEK